MRLLVCFGVLAVLLPMLIPYAEILGKTSVLEAETASARNIFLRVNQAAEAAEKGSAIRVLRSLPLIGRFVPRVKLNAPSECLDLADEDQRWESWYPGLVRLRKTRCQYKAALQDLEEVARQVADYNQALRYWRVFGASPIKVDEILESRERLLPADARVVPTSISFLCFLLFCHIFAYMVALNVILEHH